MKTERVAIPVMAAIPWDATEVCINLEAGFVSQLLGLAQILKLYRLWDGSDEEIQDVMPQVEKGIAALMGGVCCDGVATIRTNRAGYMESIDQDGNVTILGDTYDTSQIENFPDEQEVDLPGDNICAGSRLLVERMLADVLFSLDQAQYAIDGFKTGAETASAITKTIPLFNITMGEVFDAWQEWVLSVASLGVSTLKIAFSDPAVKDKMTENIYCKTMDTTNRMFTEETYFESVQDLPLLESQSGILARFMAGFEVQASGDIFAVAKRWFLLGALNEDNTCEAEFDCTPGWILEADLTLSDGGLTVQAGTSNNGVWVSGTGWTAATSFAGGAYHKNMNLEGFFPEAAYTGAGMDFVQEYGNIPGGSELWWVLGAGDHAFEIITNNVAPESPWNATGAEHIGDRALFVIPVGVLEGGDPGGFATMTKARLYGIGEPPIIEGWELVG